MSKFTPKRSWLLVIIIIAAGLRFGMAFFLGDTLDSPVQTRIWDQVSYNALANSILEGRGYSFTQYWYPFTPANRPTAHWSFLYPAFLAGVYRLTGEQPLAARLVQAAISGVLATWLCYRLGRRLFGERVGLTAAALSAIYAYFIFYDAALMTESFYIVAMLAMFELSFSIVEKTNSSQAGVAWRWVLLGTILGLAALIRQTVLLWAPFLFLWLIWSGRQGQPAWWKRLRGPALAVALMLVFILPWTVRNYRVYGAFLPLNSNAGYAFYSANHPHHGTRFDQDYAAPVPLNLRLKGLNEAQWNTALIKLGLEFILEDPRRYLLLSLSRIPIFFNFWFSADSSLFSGLMRILSFGLYLPFFSAGLILSRRQWQQNSLIYLFAVIYSAIHILTWASIRYRLPIDAVLMPYAALAVVTLAQSVLPKLAWVPVPSLGKRTSEHD